MKDRNGMDLWFRKGRGTRDQIANICWILKKAKWLSEEALQIAIKRREMKSKGEKERLYPFECRVPENSKKR